MYRFNLFCEKSCVRASQRIQEEQHETDWREEKTGNQEHLMWNDSSFKSKALECYTQTHTDMLYDTNCKGWKVPWPDLCVCVLFFFSSELLDCFSPPPQTLDRIVSGCSISELLHCKNTTHVILSTSTYTHVYTHRNAGILSWSDG